MPGPTVYDLTPLTRANRERRVVIQTFDIPVRVLTIVLLGFPVALAVTGLLVPFLGLDAIIALPVVEAAFYWVVEGRTRDGLRLRHYQAFVDNRKSNAGKFICCWQVYDPLHGRWGTLARSSAVVERPQVSYSDRIGDAIEAWIEPGRPAAR